MNSSIIFRLIKHGNPNFLQKSFLSNAMAKAKIIPEILDEAPKQKLDVSYGGVKVDLGNIFTPTQVKSPPSVTWPANKNSFYTLLMTDPDAPNPKAPVFREWHQWLVVNIPENHLEQGDTLAEYIGAGPPKGTGFHRFIFLLFLQPSGKIEFQHKKLDNKSGRGRGLFCTRTFSKKHNLGNAIAGNFFVAEFDEYVNELFKQLGFV